MTEASNGPVVPGSSDSAGGPPPGSGVEVAARLDLDGAIAAVASVARRTPLLPAPDLSDTVGRSVYLKLECLQVTGSFKVRGAAARLAALTPAERERGVVACSSGNHGYAVAYVAGRTGVPATIYVPEWVDPLKLSAIRAAGAETVIAGATFDEAEASAVAHAEASGRPYVSAYDDPWVIAGQGTIGLEILEDLSTPPSVVLAPLSGGGLIGGIAVALKRKGATPPVSTVAVTADRARVMHASLEAGQPVELGETETVASALAGGIGLGNRYSFVVVRDLVDQHVVVTEPEVRLAMAYAMRRLHVVAEGGGGVAIAALLSGRWTPPEHEGPVVAVVSGGNVSASVLAEVLREDALGPT